MFKEFCYKEKEKNETARGKMRSNFLLKEQITTLYMLMILRREERVVMAVGVGMGDGA